MNSCIGVEDQLGFHGKALGAARGDEAVDTLMKKIVNPGAHGLYPNPPTSDVPAVNISNIRLSSPPDYKLGQKVIIIPLIYPWLGVDVVFKIGGPCSIRRLGSNWVLCHHRAVRPP